MSTKAGIYYKLHKKSQIVGLILTLLLGPLGLMFSNVIAGVVLLIIGILGAPTIIIPAICWGLSVLLSFWFIHSHNSKTKAFAMLSQSD